MYYIIDMAYNAETNMYVVFVTYKQHVFQAYRDFLLHHSIDPSETYPRRVMWIAFGEHATDIHRLVISADNASFAAMDDVIKAHMTSLETGGED